MSKFGDFYLGLDTRYRDKLLQPFFFMLRRLFYAAILVSLVNRSYFQIMFMVFKTKMILIFYGYFRPSVLPFNNNLDTLNESMTLISTYSLFVFSAFVPEAKTRYLCGWYLIGLVGIMISLNLIIIIGLSFKTSLRRLKLKCIKRKKLREMRQNENDKLRRQYSLNKAHERVENDPHY